MYSVAYGNNRFLAVGEDKSYFIIEPVSKITPLLSSTFRQSIIDNATINNPQVNLYDKIINTQNFSTTIKTSVGENI
jgi:hypothetical protein